MRRTARGETLRSEEPAEESAVGGAAGRAPSELASGDHVEYLADMILELRSMAERTGAPTLAGILELAYREARLQVDLRRNL